LRGNSKDKRCFTCNKTDHFSSDYSDKTDGVVCSICKKTNYSEKDCFFRKKANKENGEDKISFLTASRNSCKWIVDSGTTAHMANKTLFKSLKQVYTQIGIAKPSETMSGEEIGNIDLESCKL